MEPLDFVLTKEEAEELRNKTEELYFQTFSRTRRIIENIAIAVLAFFIIWLYYYIMRTDTIGLSLVELFLLGAVVLLFERRKEEKRKFNRLLLNYLKESPLTKPKALHYYYGHCYPVTEERK